MNKLANNSLYLVIIIIMAAQGVVMVSAPVGQILFLTASGISLWRCFVLRLGTPEKIRDAAFCGLSVALFALAIWPR